jgi:hypothetical protein
MMGNAVSEHNNRVIATVRRSDVELPTVFAVWKHSREALNGENDNAALFRCEPDGWHQGAWRINFIEDPLEYIEDGVLVESREDEWLGARAHTILVKRVSPYENDSGKYKDTHIRYMGYKIVSHVGKPSIPVLNLNNKSEVLPAQFAQLDTVNYGYLRFKMRRGRLVNPYTYRILQRDPILAAASEYVRGPMATSESVRGPAAAAVPVPVTPVPVINKMPQRIVNVYLDSLIGANESCPIELSELTRENACMAPCGHVMTHVAITAWLRTSRTCPVCRAELGMGDLMRWHHV